MTTSPSSGLAIKLHGIVELFLEVSVQCRHLEYLVVPGGMWAVSGALDDSMGTTIECPRNIMIQTCLCDVLIEALNLSLMTARVFWSRRTQIAIAEDSEDLVALCDTSCELQRHGMQ